MPLTLDDVEALLAPAGRALLAEAGERTAAGEPELRVGADLRRRHPAPLVAAAMAQVELRARAAVKFRRAAEMLFTRDGLEQATAEDVARWRARRLGGDGTLADLCCGLGGDLLALGAGRPVVAVDADPVALRLARHNAGGYGVVPAATVAADVRDADLTGVAAAFVDPARRTGSVRHPHGYTPPLPWCLRLADRVPAVAVKAAPGLDLATVPAGWEAEFVADGRDLKEAVLWSPALAGAPRRASVLPAGVTLAGAPGRDPAVPVREPGPYLLDPSPAVTRAGLVSVLAALVDGWQLDPRIAFLSAERVTPTPFGRWLRVEASLPWNVRRLRAVLRERRVGTVDLRRRGLAGDVETVRRRLRLTGDRRAYVAMTRVADRPWAIVATAVDEPAGPVAPAP